MKMNPGHYVAILLTTTSYSSTASAKTDNVPLRVARIKLLRPTDTLLIGHVYRLVTAQEVMKGLMAKIYGEKRGKMMMEKSRSDFEEVIKRTELESI